MPPRAAPSSSVPRGRGGRGRGRGAEPAIPPGSTSGRGTGPRGRGDRGSGRGAEPAIPPGSASGRGTGPRGRGERGSGRGRGSPARAATAGGSGLPDASPHITTVGVKRAAFGTSGRAIQVTTNHFEVKIPEGNIYHYDVISPSEKTLPTRLNMEIIRRLQTVISPQTFTPRAVYDGRKNLFAARQLPFGTAREFDVTLVDLTSPGDAAPARPPKVYKVKLSHVATINPEVLSRFLQGKQSHDNTVLTAIMALNVVIRMEPTLKYPFNVRSFFTDREKRDIGSGMVLWRGYFQSVRPAIGRLLINVDISTGVMYKPGPVLDIAMEFMGMRHPSQFKPENQRDKIRLQRFLSGVRIVVEVPGQHATGRRTPRAVKRISAGSASRMTFVNREGQTLSVAEYFKRTYNYQLHFPHLPCIEVGSGALLPMEVCQIPEGQIMRKQVPPEKTKDVLDFATKKPFDRLNSIRAGLGVLAYGQSEYVRQFGLVVQPNAGPLSVQARVMEPPRLQYGEGSKQRTIMPRNGAWNMIDKTFLTCSEIKRWCVVVFERREYFRPDLANEMVAGLLQALASVGIQVQERDPIVRWVVPQKPVAQVLKEVGGECFMKNSNSGGPDLIVAVLPEASADLYMRIKHFGDITQGVATQCLRSSKCMRANMQYYANVCLKINSKLGGINTIPDARDVPALTDPHNPTIVMGADVMHPAPGADGRPSFASLVGNVDSNTAKYVADCRVQTSRQEMIDNLKEMALDIIKMNMGYRLAIEKNSGSPRRIIFYRDGVSEGQFKDVLEYELPQLRGACVEAGIPTAKITIIVVSKRHHVRFFPQNANDADRSGNCPAGMVVDKDIVHPTELDYYLQSHSGVLHDDNKFTTDALQSLSFALCHVHARCTRSVSIPAPVYYADMVCARAKNHYDPDGHMDFEGSGGSLDDAQKATELAGFKAGFRAVHSKMHQVMYFS